MRGFYHAGALRAASIAITILARVALPPIDILDADDPRVADYRLLKERRLNEEGRFVAESERVVRRLVGSGLPIQSVLLTAPRLATLGDALGGDFPVYLASQSLLDRVAGFHVHRGCLAVGVQPARSPRFPATRARWSSSRI